MAFKTVALICALAVIANGDDKFANNTQPCHPRVYEKLDTCCAMPKLLPMEVFKTCFASQRPEGLNEKRSRSKRDAPESGTIIKRRNFGPPGGPMCLIECVFEKEVLINSNKEVVLQAVQEKFIAESGDVWKPLVKEVTFNCYTELQKVDFASLAQPPAGVNVCKPQSAMLLSCIRRQLTLRCPATELRKSENDVDCTTKIETLRKCDPFAIPAPRSLLNGQLREAIEKGSKSFKGKRLRGIKKN